MKKLGLISALALCSCVTTKPVLHDPHGDYDLSLAERVAIDYAVKRDLLDPYSARIEDVSAGRDLVKPGLITFCGQLNAKNRMGGYVGRSPFYGNLRNGQVTFLLVDGYEKHDASLNCLGLYDSLLEYLQTKKRG
jgi:hypothetical protein